MDARAMEDQTGGVGERPGQMQRQRQGQGQGQMQMQGGQVYFLNIK